jgi:hypothetical protein
MWIARGAAADDATCAGKPPPRLSVYTDGVPSAFVTLSRPVPKSGEG